MCVGTRSRPAIPRAAWAVYAVAEPGTASAGRFIHRVAGYPQLIFSRWFATARAGIVDPCPVALTNPPPVSVDRACGTPWHATSPGSPTADRRLAHPPRVPFSGGPWLGCSARLRRRPGLADSPATEPSSHLTPSIRQRPHPTHSPPNNSTPHRTPRTHQQPGLAGSPVTQPSPRRFPRAHRQPGLAHSPATDPSPRSTPSIRQRPHPTHSPPNNSTPHRTPRTHQQPGLADSSATDPSSGCSSLACPGCRPVWPGSSR
jgi:hypothetical protein